MKNNQFLLPALLLAAVLLTASCSSGTEGTDTAAVTDNGTQTTETVTDDGFVHDNLPDDLDFSGKTYRLLTSTTTQNATVLVEEETGDLLDDAKYRRLRTVSERFDITFTENVMEWRDARDSIKNTVSAGDDAYDLASIVDREALTLASQNMLFTFDDLPYNDLTAPWWNASINNGITIAGKQVLAYSDFSISTYDFTHVLVYNKQMAEQLDLTSPYELVDAGTWTLEKYREYMAAAMRDVNGDGVMDREDIYGFHSDSRHIAPTLWVGAGVQSIVKDENDLPVYAMGDEKMLEVLEIANDLYWGEKFWYSKAENTADSNMMFVGGGSLFVNAMFGRLFGEDFRGMETDYGIIPYPKYDEAQDTYYTRVEGGTPYVVPTTAGDVEFSSAILEALSCESYNTLLPIYYELALKTKLTRDEQSVKILDMIMQNRVYDLGDTFFCDQLRDGFVVSYFSSGKLINASTVEARGKVVINAINKVTAPYIE